MVLISEVHDFVMDSILVLIYVNVASKGSVRCCTSALTAKRISNALISYLIVGKRADTYNYFGFLEQPQLVSSIASFGRLPLSL